MIATAEPRNHAKRFLKKAEEYLASSEANLAAKRYTPAAGDAIHAGINAKDAILTALTGSTRKGEDHATAAKDLRQALAKRSEAAAGERALRELVAAKGEVEYGTDLVTATKAEPLVRRARTLLDLAIGIVRLGR
jgi:HEPN domain-containing protein